MREFGENYAALQTARFQLSACAPLDLIVHMLVHL